MSRLYNNFEFVGNIFIPQSKEKFHDIRESASGWTGHRLNFAVQESKTNSAFVEFYGGYSKSKENKVYSFSKGTESNKGTKLEIPWGDRLKAETLDMVADFKKIIVDYTTDPALKEEISKLKYEIRTLEYKDELTTEDIEKVNQLKLDLKVKATDVHEFIHNYDAITFLSETLEKHKDKKFRVTGSIDVSHSKGKFYRKFNPELIEVVSNDEPSKLRANIDIYFTQDSLDDVDFEEDKKVYINGFILSYDSDHKKDVFFPQQFVINAAKVDFTNEQHVKRFEFFKKKFVTEDEGVYHLQWLVNIFRGADEVDFTVDNLSDAQKEAIEFGINKLSDFAPKGGLLGVTTEENRLVKPILLKINESNDFTEGAVVTAYTEEDLAYTPAKKKEQPKKEEPVVDVTTDDAFKEADLDDLFA